MRFQNSTRSIRVYISWVYTAVHRVFWRDISAWFDYVLSGSTVLNDDCVSSSRFLCGSSWARLTVDWGSSLSYFVRRSLDGIHVSVCRGVIFVSLTGFLTTRVGPVYCVSCGYFCPCKVSISRIWALCICISVMLFPIVDFSVYFEVFGTSSVFSPRRQCVCSWPGLGGCYSTVSVNGRFSRVIVWSYTQTRSARVDRLVLSAVTLDRVCEMELLRPRRATVCLSVVTSSTRSCLPACLHAHSPFGARTAACGRTASLSQRQHRQDLNRTMFCDPTLNCRRILLLFVSYVCGIPRFGIQYFRVTFESLLPMLLPCINSAFIPVK